MLGYSGCCYYNTDTWCYLPQVSVKAYAAITSSACRTTLTQSFFNPSELLIEEVSYTFPLYDGVSVVGFECRVGSRLLHSKVKTKEQAQSEYHDAVANQQTAAIMDHTMDQNDVFVIRLGNVPAKETITVDITFVGELKQDSQSDGVRYTLPNSIAPRYGSLSNNAAGSLTSHGLPADLKGISVTVDVLMEKDSILRELQSPSHSVKVSLGRMSSTSADVQSFDPSKASATLRLVKGEHALLERDFVLVIKADGLDKPRALLETHPTLPGQRALMVSLVPKFSLPPAQPEVVFVIDRSGSMNDKVDTLKSSLQIFLKSLPVGICFNICSFGSIFSFLWPKSRVYDASSLEDALRFVSSISANMGGTEMQSAVVATVQNRLKDKELEVLLLTDGQISRQEALFDFVRTSAADNTVRFFSLAIGNAASHSLVEGVSRAGNGFSQSVINYEELDQKVVRMLKGALTPHISDYKLEVQYEGKADEDFEFVDSDVPMSDFGTNISTSISGTSQKTLTQQPISLFDANFKGSDAELGSRQQADDKSLPIIPSPSALQAPYKIPSLYPFIRTTVYFLLDPRYLHRIPQSLAFRATSKFGPLELQIPISDSGTGETIHQLASRKAVVELEENHGWLQDAHDEFGNPFHQFHSDTQQRIVARECQTLGIKYQVTGKYCSFVALENDESLNSEERPTAKEIETRTVPVVKMIQGGHRSSRSLRPSGNPTTIYSAHAFGAFGAAPPPQPNAPAPRVDNGRVMMMQSSVAPKQPFNVSTSSSHLFGSPAPPPPPPASGGALFGASAGTMPYRPPFGTSSRSPPTRSSSFEAFGQAQPPAQPSAFGAPPGGLFGSSAQQTTGGSLFGRPSQSQQFQQFQSSAFGASSGGLFASSTQSAQDNSLFGRQSSGPTPFGNTTSPSQASMSMRKASLVARQEQDNAEPSPLTYQSKVHALVGLQSFEGNWEWKQDLFDVIGFQIKDVQAQILGLLQVESLDGEARNIAATILALGFLVNKHADSKGLWELVSDKAEAWISNKLPQIGFGQVIESHKSDIMALV
ncbi:hypothetical protein PEBR_13349 [Penicillium brasilianum]|uniref:von Willebrand domain protein n=1 Tax=Penicillium brasilianum TaxID=104259 RepID=A0A1S9RS19_PENBI|nr:hypothetical protein PEBR_13349 [Penicillium brasilianum]